MSTNISLQLGDVIKIISPTNSSLHNHIYLIRYIDSTTIKIGKDISEPEEILNVEDGELADKSIETIELLFRQEYPGYAKQNGLVEGKWIEFRIDDEVPILIVGLIKELVEDQIKVETYPSKDILFIDFGYKGIPKDIPITDLKLRETPKNYKTEETKESDEDEEDDVVITELSKDDIEDLIRAGDMVFEGEIIQEENVIQIVSSDNMRYGIEEQASDLYNSMIEGYSDKDRTRRIDMYLNRIIDRYTRLREEISTYDENNFINGFIKPNKDKKPLVESLKEFSQKLSWIIPVIKENTRLYDIDRENKYDNDINLFKTLTEVQNLSLGIDPNDPNVNLDVFERYVKINELLKTYDNTIEESDNNEILINKQVKHSLEVVIDNINKGLKHFYSYFKNNEEKLKLTRFVLKKYNMGESKEIKEATRYSLKGIVNMIKNKTRNADVMNLSSLLILPESFVEYAKINLPNTSILRKTELNQHSLQYWKFLKNNTQVVSKNTSENNSMFTKKEFTNKIIHLMNDTNLSEENKYELFLQHFVPNIEKIMELLKDKLDMCFDYSTFVNELEPFMIYTKDIHLNDYMKITEFIERNVEKYLLNVANNMIPLEKVKSYNYKNAYVSNIYLDLLKLEKTKVKIYHENVEENQLFNSEMFSLLMKLDYGELYFTLLRYKNINLLTELDLQNDIENMLKVLNDKNDDTQSGSRKKCKNIVLSKRYYSHQELIQDNENDEVYFDKDLDPTRYELLQEYSSVRDTMTEEQFENFLIDTLVSNIGMNREDAIIEANALINNRRKVENDNYAVLIFETDDEINDLNTELENDENKQMMSKYNYYVRRENMWVNDLLLKENEREQLLQTCNITQECIIEDDSCVNMDSKAKELMVRRRYEELLQTYKDNKQKSFISQKRELEEDLERKQQEILELSNYIETKNNERSKIRYNLGKKILEEGKVINPNLVLFDRILGTSDLSLRMKYLEDFIYKFTRDAVPGEEDDHWLYCMETNQKLVPSMYIDMIQGYKYNAYNETIEEICKTRGEISDDGNKWVDKYSGYTITNIDFVEDVLYDENGFKMVSSEEVVNEDFIKLDEVIQQGDILDENKVSYDSSVYKIMKVANSSTGLMIKNIILFILNSIHITSKVIKNINKSVVFIYSLVNEDAVRYKNIMVKRVKEGKLKLNKKQILEKLTEFKNRLYVSLISSFVFVMIQSSTPSVYTNKTFPGCKKSFHGYPLIPNKDDNSGIEYIACVLKKISTKEAPWNSISRLSVEEIKTSMISVIEKKLLNNETIQKMINDKRIYLENVGDEGIIPEYLSIRTWKTFRPYLDVLENVSLESELSNDFIKNYIKNISTGTTKSDEKYQVLMGKLHNHSLYLQDQINKTLKGEIGLLETQTGSYYLENACCNDGPVDTMDYIISKNKAGMLQESSIPIKDLLKILDIEEKLYYQTKFLERAKTLIDPTDTKLIYPSIVDRFSEENIFRAFIKYCKFGTSSSVPPYLREYCKEENVDINLLDPIDERITQMKDSGVSYTLEELNNLLTKLGKLNSYTIDYNVQENNYNTIIDTLTSLEENEEQLSYIFLKEDDELININIITLLKEQFIELNKMDLGLNNSFGNSLERTNTFLYEIIDKQIEFIKEFTELNLSSKNKKYKEIIEIEKIKEFENIIENKFEFNDKTNILDSFKVYNFIDTIIPVVAIDIPNIIKNIKVDVEKNIKVVNCEHESAKYKHWGLSQNHNIEICKFIEKTHRDFYIYSEYSKDIMNYVLINNSLILKLRDTIRFIRSKVKVDEQIGTNMDDFNMLFQQFLLNQILITYIETKDVLDTNDLDIETLEGDEQIERLGVDEDGENVSKAREIVDILAITINYIIRQKSRINVNKEQILDKVNRSKEREKDYKTRTLKDLKDEERDADNYLKQAKLGRWNVGMQKGMFSYDKDFYDNEIKEMNKEMEIDTRLGLDPRVNNMNRDVYGMELMEEMRVDEQIEKEAYNMAHLGDDDDYVDGYEEDQMIMMSD